MTATTELPDYITFDPELGADGEKPGAHWRCPAHRHSGTWIGQDDNGACAHAEAIRHLNALHPGWDAPAAPFAADDWNAAHPIGTPVLAWPGARDDEPMVTRTRTPAWTLAAGDHVVSVEGAAGGIALTHVEPRSDDPVTADECSSVSPHGDVCVRLSEHDGMCQSVERKRVSSPGQAGKPWRWYRDVPAPAPVGAPAEESR